MPCGACQSDITYTSISLNPITDGCSGCESIDGPSNMDSACVIYSGSPLSCSGIFTGVCLEAVIQKFDEKLCSIGTGPADYLTYDLSCLRDKYQISSAKQFAESVADYSCKIDQALVTFSTETNTRINDVNTRIDSIFLPNVESCQVLGITSKDNLPIVITKLIAAGCSLYDLVNPSAANWERCFTLIGDPPSTVVEGFNKVLDYICSIQQGSTGSMPVFSNTGTCIGGGNTDSLQDTVIKIRNRLCQVPTFNAGNIASQTCFLIKADDSLETVISAIAGQLTVIGSGAIRQVDTTQFSLSDIDPAKPCAGKKLSLNAGMDRKVTVTDNDQAAGTLSEKIVAGPNINLDIISTPGKMIISSSGGAASDEKVKSAAADPTPGYLSEKITGSEDGDIKISANMASNQVKISASLNYTQVITRMLDTISDDAELKGLLCDLIRSCPSPCAPPSNVQIVLA